jgi:hypothetical protein
MPLYNDNNNHILNIIIFNLIFLFNNNIMIKDFNNNILLVLKFEYRII